MSRTTFRRSVARMVRSGLSQAAGLAKRIRDKADESLTDAERAIGEIFAATNRVRVHWGWGGGRRPHQGERECARRQGGAAWRRAKAWDRVRRGLQP